MSDIKREVSLPLDDDGFLRRQCPFCNREFKVKPDKEELVTLAQKGIDSFLVDQQMKEESTVDSDSKDEAVFCPYCGQQASKDKWWTIEQLNYIHIFAKNIMARIVNEQLIKQLKRMSGSKSGLVSMRFDGKEIEQEEPWISPEPNDMRIIELPCCKRKIKIDDLWDDKKYCFFCGFPHGQR